MKPESRWDSLFAYWAGEEWPALDWRFTKAQATIESSLRPRVVSSAGAVGLLQLLPGTFAEAVPAGLADRPVNEPEANIAAGIHYLRRQFDRLPEIADHVERLMCATASYNCGRGYINAALAILRERHRPGNPPPGSSITWEDLKPHLATARCRGRTCQFLVVWRYVDDVFSAFTDLTAPRWSWQRRPPPIQE